ncbi:conserved unknown protein [Ectocarpus siliculosus]|uniref:Uncharacterized protein n=1 Tax=Ectocarpus siliculosus TaxID=2880 RepID=D8LNA5_ECTSI|nr:conserved unknown protein [Ectocarpus siliculosus]|eukprot:CBN77262.1 conserved unknown protein [Ectocarpus siliculosus]
MWQDFSAHNTQRGDVTAVVWGAPGSPPATGESTGTVRPSSAAGSVDAEALTRGRRADTPFVQQCDLVFPLPDQDGESDGHDHGDTQEKQQKQLEMEKRAKAFVVRALGKTFYYRARGPLSALLREPFLRSYVLKRGFSALALNAPSDHGNSFAILPGGVLALSLDRESFQTLGLPGEAAPTRPNGKGKRAGAGAGSTGGSVGVLGGGAGGPDRYVSAVDLSAKSFRPGKPLHDRVLSCLSSCRWGNGDDGSAVDMVVYFCGSGGVGQGSGEGGEVAEAGSSGTSEASGQAPEGCGQGAAAVGGSRKGERAEGEQEGQQSQHCCRDITFPPGFSAERVDLAPDIRFFREACCPDLDFVGQGLAATAPTTPAQRVRRKGRKGIGAKAFNSTPTAENLVDDGDDGGSDDQFTDSRHPHLPPPLPSPPESAKCLLVLDMFEWLGAVSCGLDAAVRRSPSPPEPYLSKFETPRHLRYRSDRIVCRARLRGFLPPVAISRFVDAAGSAAAAVAAVASAEDSAADSRQHYESPQLLPVRRVVRDQGQQRPDGCSWGAVTSWPFRDAPRAYPGADAPCAGGQRSKRGGRKGRGGGGDAERCAKEWPVGGHGVYTVVACPGETAVAFVAAKCPGPGW